MDLLPDHLHALVPEDSASEEMAQLYKQAAHVAMLRMPYNIPSGASFSPFKQNRFGNLTRHLVTNKTRWLNSAILGCILSGMTTTYIPLPEFAPDAPLIASIVTVFYLPLLFVTLTAAFAPFLFFLSTLLEFVPSYGFGAFKAIKAPTAICIAPLSIKFVWVNGLIFLRPRMHGFERTLGWEEILGVDCREGAQSLPLIVITARIMHRNEIFPVHLAGLANQADRQALLHALDSHIAPARKSSAFMELIGSSELPKLLASKSHTSLEDSDPVAQLFLTSDKTSLW